MKKRVVLIIMMVLVLTMLLAACVTRTPSDIDTNTGTDIVIPPDDNPGDTSEGEGSGTADPSTCRHSVVIDERVEPTCEEEGYTEGRHCPSCGKVFIAQRPIEPIGHSEAPNQDVLPTCSAFGYTGGTHCENCNMEMDPATQIAKVPHIEADKPTVPSTCTAPGSLGGVYCTVCGETLEDSMIIPVKGHTEVPNEEVLPTCEKTGKTGGSHCSVCDAELTKSTVVPATGHTEVDSEYVAPTCTELGYSGGTHCSTCEKVLTQGEEIPKIAHTEVENDYLAPTCTKVGYSGGTICDVCSEIIKKGTEIPALGHNETVLSGYAPTCSKTGLTEGKHCSRCNTDTVKQAVLDKISHTEVITPTVAPTCQSVGYTEKRQCSACGEVTLKSEQIPKIGHTVVIDKAVSATCSQTGLTEGSHCGVCNTVLSTQQVVAKNNNHVYPDFAAMTKTPTFSASGSGTLTCTKCSHVESITFTKLTASKLTEDDIYSIETDIYNPAYDGRWKVVDGSTAVSGIYGAGDWFGNVGDVLTITLKQEMALTNLKIYGAGNYTKARITVKDTAGNTTVNKTVTFNGATGGGTPVSSTLASGTNVKAYTIEIEILELKWEDARTFKVSELEITAAPYDTRISHTHAYREFVETTRAATCQITGIDTYKCFCGKENAASTPKGEHKYDTLKEITLVSCTSKGKAIYACECGATQTIETEPIGHIFDKLVSCSITPTRSTRGEAQYKCVNCSLTEDRVLDYLPLEEINYLRVDKIEGGRVVLKLNIYEERPSYEVRYSTAPITEENYESATILDANISGTALVTITVNLDAGLDKCYYVAVKPYEGENYGEMSTVRVGGDLEIPIDYDKAQVYHGEVLNSFKVMFDGDTETTLGNVFPEPGENEEDISGSPVRPIVDLEYGHYVTKVRLYYAEAGKSFTVRWSDTPVDFMAESSEWDGYITKTSASGWNEVTLNTYTRYVQVIFTDGEAPSELEAYGYQCGEGDEISTWKNTQKPTIDELIGMCGFVAGGNGNTPIDSVSCVGVLREYHNFGWSYTASNYGKQASFFTGWMANFDEQYRLYKAAGLNVIPCIQWSLGTGETISYKVGSNNLPVTDSSGALVRSSFWERFNPHTYFVYADNMFAFSARYGRNSSQSLLQIAQAHCSSESSVGQGTIEWIEMGNEPDGGWNGIHNYLSAYQLAAATSAAYDGHCATMVSPAAGGYHLGGKNADPTMKLALAGVSAVSNEYITALCYWMKANRDDGSTAFDAFNVHNYMTKSIELPNGAIASVGISPEEAKIQETLSALIELRDKYYPEKEVWITEFGWDTNQSYATSTSAHAYGNYTGRQVQAMWLTRTYLLLSAIGIDKADMYMCEDTGPEETSVGKYGTSGVIAFETDANGNTIEVKKDSYYYLYTLKNTLGSYSFDCEIEAYDENVMIYKYTTAEGKAAYALWCKTSDGTTSTGYNLGINAEGATLVEAVYGDTDGQRSALTADEYGYVQVDVSENPVYVIVD